MERVITHRTSPVPPGADPNVEIRGHLMYHKPTNISVVIKEPRGTAELRRAHGTLMGLVRFAGRHDDRSLRG